jgi:hypothetical protein
MEIPIIKRTSTATMSNPSSSTPIVSPRSAAIPIDMLEWSDDDKEDAVPLAPMDFQTACDIVLNFGKHKGQTVGELLRGRKTRDYLRWCLENFEGLFSEPRAAIEICLTAYERAKETRGVTKKRKLN